MLFSPVETDGFFTQSAEMVFQKSVDRLLDEAIKVAGEEDAAEE